MTTQKNHILKQLITLAGSQVQLAKLLGVQPYNIYDWLKAGRISKRGALLIESSVVFGSLLKAHELRPDIESNLWIKFLTNSEYIKSRRKQLNYEQSEAFKTETPIVVLETLKK